MSVHSQLTGLELHESFHYTQESDPGAVGSSLYWIKPTTGALKRRNAANNAWTSIGGSPTFLGLLDVPASFTGQTLKLLRVNAGETALEFVTATSFSVATDTIWNAAGDLAVGTGSDTATRLAIGTAFQALRVNSGATGLEWATLATPTTIANDTLWAAAGDLVYATANDTATRLAVGTALQYLRVNAGATAPEWATLTTIATDVLWAAAGDLVYATANDTATRLAIGTALQVLRVNAGATAPEWSTPVSTPTTVTLTDGATITWTLLADKTYNLAKVTLGGNRTLAFSGLADGMTGVLRVIQDGTGSRTLTLPANSKVNGGGAGVITLTAAASSTDIISFTTDGTNIFWTYGNNFS